MAVVFCDEDLFIMDYNRVVRDLNGLSREELLEKLRASFDVAPADAVPGEGYAPRAKHEFGMYLDGRWYSLTAKPGTFPADHPIESLDCAILQANPRTSDRIDFVGGIRGLGELERRCSGEMALAFSLYPVTMTINTISPRKERNWPPGKTAMEQEAVVLEKTVSQTRKKLDEAQDATRTAEEAMEKFGKPILSRKDSSSRKPRLPPTKKHGGPAGGSEGTRPED